MAVVVGFVGDNLSMRRSLMRRGHCEVDVVVVLSCWMDHRALPDV